MKQLMLISILFLLASCGENSKKNHSNSILGEPYHSVLSKDGDVLIPVIVENEAAAPIIVQDEDTSPEVEVINEEAKALVCDFTNENQQSSFSILLKNKMIVLKDLEKKGKPTFDRHIFSPSGNEKAAVHHEDKDFSIEEGKVLKITARIIMSEDLKSGELQVSYKVKAENKKTIQIEFRKLADVKDCVEE